VRGLSAWFCSTRDIERQSTALESDFGGLEFVSEGRESIRLER
jgi:hypothetical protein